MREIKFRAWFTEEKRMYSHKEIINEIGYKGLVDNSSPVWIPMQYTGLKDKNGKEIYDSDILEIYDLSDLNEPIERAGVVFENGGFWMLDDHLCDWDTDSCVIIGNIYENKELLKEKI